MLSFEHTRNHPSGRIGKTIVIDMGPDTLGWTGRHGLADLLEVMGDYIDYAKIWGLNAVTIPHAYTQDIVRQYKAAGVQPFAGGLLYEYAYLKNEIEPLVELLQHLGIGGIEVSENYISLSHEDRLRETVRMKQAGLDVVFEFGRKKPDTPMLPETLEKVVSEIMDAGAAHVILEQSEFDLLDEVDSGAVDDMVSRPWFRHVFIEADPFRFPAQHADLIQRFGPEVNLANIAPGQVLRVENFRRGLGRTIDFPLIRDLVDMRDNKVT